MISGFPGCAEAVHVTPRRVRVRSTRMKRNAAGAHRAEQALAALPGITAARINPTTGSIVLHFEPEQWTPEVLLAHLREQGYLAPPSPRTAHYLRRQRDRAVVTQCCFLIAKELLGAAITHIYPNPLVATLLAVV